MNLIDQVGRLKELEAARDSCQDRTVFAFLERLQQDAPAMLEVLGGFQPGYADSLDFMLEYLCDDPNDNRDPEIETTKKVLCRMQAMAVRMEESK